MKIHQYNPLDSVSFKQAQIASTLASDVSEFALYFTCIYILKNLTFFLKQSLFFHLMNYCEQQSLLRCVSGWQVQHVVHFFLWFFYKGLQSFHNHFRCVSEDVTAYSELITSYSVPLYSGKKEAGLEGNFDLFWMLVFRGAKCWLLSSGCRRRSRSDLRVHLLDFILPVDLWNGIIKYSSHPI